MKVELRRMPGNEEKQNLNEKDKALQTNDKETKEEETSEKDDTEEDLSVEEEKEEENELSKKRCCKGRSQ